MTVAPEANDPIIVVDHLWKSYRPKTHQLSLRHEAVKALKQALHRPTAENGEIFWALKDVCFTVSPGESVAVIGRNGSGKTTLLRVLCGITRAARGRAFVGGSFATLIALGAGFNFERTGRENIYLNAAIQGVNPRAVAEVAPDIIEFSGLGDFIDVPVKRYSSGMVTRLGFSIASHILPEIIFVDEVLAVGDVGFQEKCKEKMKVMTAEGRTLLFVSHDPNTVQQLCERAVWLDHGRLRMDGSVSEVMGAYGEMLRQQGREGG